MAGLQKHFEGKYEVLERLETDTAGDVYRVRHLFLEELRLVRVLNPHLAMTPEIGEGFLQEARNATRLRHPNIAQLHDFILEDDGSAVIISELVEGPTLAEALGELGPMPPRLALEAAQQALRGIGYLHRAGHIHRDISPDKLRLTRDVDGQVLAKWMDLGIAKVLDAGEGLPISGMFPARPRYAAPERFSGLDGGLDARSDLYSFGIVLYELLTGRCPIPGHDGFSYMAGHLSAPPLDFAESDPDGKLLAELRAILLQTLAKKPEERLQNAEDLARRLAAVQIQLPADGSDAYFNRALEMARKRNEATRRLRIDDAFKTAVVPLVPASTQKPSSPATPAPELQKTRPLPRNVEPSAPTPAPPVPGNTDWADRMLTAAAEPLPRSVEAPAPARQEPPPPGLATGPTTAPAAVPSLPAAEPTKRLSWTLLVAGVLVLAGLGAGWFLFRPKTPLAPSETSTPSRPTPPVETVEVSTAPAPPPQVIEKDPTQASSSTATTNQGGRSKPDPGQEPPRPRIVVPPPPRDTTSATTVEVSSNATLPSGPMKRGDFITGRGPNIEQAEVGVLANPVYPEAARGTGRSARVSVSVLVDENGNVLNARVKEGDPSRLGFNEAAVAAAKKSRFLPATRDGIPGKSWTDLAFEFDPPPPPATPQTGAAPAPTASQQQQPVVPASPPTQTTETPESPPPGTCQYL